MGKLIRKGSALLIVMVLLVSFAVPAFANEQVTATVALNLRSGPGTNYPIVGELKMGETATRIGTTGNWSIIQMGNSKLYASSAYLTTGSVGGSSSESVMYTSIKLNVRSGPGTSFKVISQLDKGAAVSVLGTSGSWSIIRWNDSTAYVFTSYLTGSGSSSSSSSGGTLMTATSNVNVRTGPGTNYKAIGVLMAGQTVTRTGTSGSWSKVIFNGTTAYIHSAYLKASSGSSSSGGSFETTTTVNVRSGPGSSYSVLGTLPKGQRVTGRGTVGSWTMIDFKSGTGYIITSSLTPVSSSSVSPAIGMMRVVSTATVRTGAGNSYNSLGTLSTGTLVPLTGFSGSWAQIDYNGRTAYVPANTLTDAYSFNVSSASGDYAIDYMLTGYEGPGTGYPSVYRFRGGEIVRRTGISGSWTRITYLGMSMFVPSSAITRLESFISANKLMFTKNASVLYYTEPVNSGWHRIGSLSAPNEAVLVTGVGSSWVRVLMSNRTYYIMSGDLWEYPDDTYNSSTNNSITSSTAIPLYSDKGATVPNVTIGSTSVTAANGTDHTVTFIEVVSTSGSNYIIKVKVADKNNPSNTAIAYIKSSDITTAP